MMDWYYNFHVKALYIFDKHFPINIIKIKPNLSLNCLLNNEACKKQQNMTDLYFDISKDL